MQRFMGPGASIAHEMEISHVCMVSVVRLPFNWRRCIRTACARAHARVHVRAHCEPREHRERRVLSETDALSLRHASTLALSSRWPSMMLWARKPYGRGGLPSRTRTYRLTQSYACAALRLSSQARRSMRQRTSLRNS
eukprot:3784847-Pleurochrysis_carterae.AAC.1